MLADSCLTSAVHSWFGYRCYSIFLLRNTSHIASNTAHRWAEYCEDRISAFIGTRTAVAASSSTPNLMMLTTTALARIICYEQVDGGAVSVFPANLRVETVLKPSDPRHRNPKASKKRK